MNTYNTPHINPVNRPGQPANEDFDQLAQHLQTTEYLTVTGFMRRVQHRWHLDEITRFGARVGKAADAMQLSYLTTVDQSLGPVRIFPLPFLTRIYQIMAPQFGWPRIVEVETPSIADQRKLDQEALRAHEKMAKALRDLLPALPDTGIQHSCAVMLAWLGEECDRLRRQLGEEAARGAEGEAAISTED